MDIINPRIHSYLDDLHRTDDNDVLIEMERIAEDRGFPIVGRLCGRVLEVMTRSIGGKRIFEMGSGFGFSAYWFSRATGDDGEIHLTDRDESNGSLALELLERAGLARPVRFHVGDALEIFEGTEGDFDVVFCDIDKMAYPDAWTMAKERIRPGGLFMCDNMLGSGSYTVVEPGDKGPWMEAVDRTNRAIEADPDWRSFILPTREGVVVALRLK